MRHYFKFRKFNSKNSYRKSLFNNICNSFIKYEFINISFYKAKEIRIFLEPLINISKNYSSHNFKFLFKKLNNIESVFKLFKILGPRYFYRNGGYLKIYKVSDKRGFFLKSFIFFS
ncbi:50S ribosomal protein L17 [Candidatus Nasuia deltocephalinicola]|uniref:50S ribosomal protein L17 n=1 Tax=Candidatus Nasuia deltocephalincola TaxID=1160784 RepID=A0A974WL01_9PROT|nr:50S ribosomal protein L17 [Candidatus Nasuia deltocephalinicola]WKD87139.1 L17 family ribosomal protein [Candidatus Nasuia deltocephalinicola]BEH03927.1 50S ribosomal protein L17 [Candidatus Nasuia deltocephalinicola]